MKKSPAVIFHLLLLAATSSMAMSLGRYRGAVLVGKPLDISVQAVLDPAADSAGFCIEADVFYADAKVDGSRVRVTMDRLSSASGESVIHIRSSALIDEPVVTVNLRTGCQQKTERRYVLLADVVSDTINPSQPVVIIGPTVSAPSTPAAGESASRASSAPSVAGSGTSGRSAGRVPIQSGTGASAANTIKTQPVMPAVGSSTQLPGMKSAPNLGASRNSDVNTRKGARLKLDPLDLVAERDPLLKSSPELLSTPTSNEQERSVAAALWRVLNARPEDLLKDTEKLRALENSVAELQAQIQKNKQTFNELNVELEQVRSERYANTLVYLLATMLLMALGVAAYLWRKRADLRNSQTEELPWWRKNKTQEKGWGNSLTGAAESAAADQPDSPDARKKARKVVPGTLDLDLDLGLDEPAYTEVKHISGLGVTDSMLPLSAKDKSDFAMSMTHMSRAVKAEELFDVQQQADFFISLGQHDQAIEVLREHIDDNVHTSALVYLDLFNLYHQLKREADYDALREDFGQRFNAKMPVFALYSDASPGLEAYPSALMRIEALWPSPKVLEVIEESIFRKPNNHSEAFDMGAYRELLLLYAVAKDIIGHDAAQTNKLPKFDLNRIPEQQPTNEQDNASKFLATSIQPLSASVAEGVIAKTTAELPPILPKPSPRLGLDLDLSDAFDIPVAIQKDKVRELDLVEEESDSQFFAQFAIDAAAASKDIKLPNTPIGKLPDVEISNLIDFDAFDSSIPPDEHSSALPKV